MAFQRFGNDRLDTRLLAAQGGRADDLLQEGDLVFESGVDRGHDGRYSVFGKGHGYPVLWNRVGDLPAPYQSRPTRQSAETAKTALRHPESLAHK